MLSAPGQTFREFSCFCACWRFPERIKFIVVLAMLRGAHELSASQLYEVMIGYDQEYYSDSEEDWEGDEKATELDEKFEDCAKEAKVFNKAIERVHCDVCNIDIASCNFSSHIAGKKHRTVVLQNKMAEKATLLAQDPHHVFLSAYSYEFFCKLSVSKILDRVSA